MVLAKFMFWFTNFVYLRLETLVLVRFVLDNPQGTISLLEGVNSLNLVAVPFFYVLLFIPRVWIVHCVIVGVLHRSVFLGYQMVAIN